MSENGIRYIPAQTTPMVQQLLTELEQDPQTGQIHMLLILTPEPGHQDQVMDLLAAHLAKLLDSMRELRIAPVHLRAA